MEVHQNRSRHASRQTRRLRKGGCLTRQIIRVCTYEAVYLDAVSGAGDTAFCVALLEHAKSFYSAATANCEKVAPRSAGGAIRVGGNVQQANLLKQARPSYP